MFNEASLASFLFAFSFYTLLAPHFGETKQRAWIITFLSSTITSLGSLPFLWDFIESGGNVGAISHRPELAHAICGSFQGLLLSDLVTGFSNYPKYLSPVSGWTHHIAYALMLPYIIYRGWAHIFCVCLTMEIPTCILSSSFLWPQLRNDVFCAIVFFFTRIVMHLVLIVEMLLPRGRNAAADGSLIPSCILILAFALHASWFLSNVKGIIRRARATRPNKTDTVISKAQELLSSTRRVRSMRAFQVLLSFVLLKTAYASISTSN